MRREGDLISFDEVDRSRYAGLEGWLPIEATPGLFEELTEEQVRLRLELSELRTLDEPSRAEQNRLVETNRQLCDLDMVKKQLGMLACDEIAAGFTVEEMLDGVPGVDFLHLYEK